MTLNRRQLLASLTAGLTWGAAGLPTTTWTFVRLGCDFIAAGTHKWLSLPAAQDFCGP